MSGEQPPALTPCASVAILDDDGHILLLRRSDDGSWCLPGGHLEPGESFVECARRECREELGHEVALDGLVGVGSDPRRQTHRYPDGRFVQFVGVVLRGRLGPRVAEPDGEAVEVGWFALDDLPRPILLGDAPAIDHLRSGSSEPLID